MVEAKKNQGSRFAEGVELTKDIVERSSAIGNIIIINGLFYLHPHFALAHLTLNPQTIVDFVETGLIVYDVCKLSCLIAKGTIRRIVKVKDCILALHATVSQL